MSDLLTALGGRIVCGVYAPGTTLPTEQELAREFNVGRNAVREAIKTLIGKQLVRTGRRSGTTVRPVSEWSQLDAQVLQWRFSDPDERVRLAEQLGHLRRVIEPAIAAAAAERATTVQILRIFEAFETMESAAEERDAAIAADVAFHTRIFEAANNVLLTSMATSLTMLLALNYELAIDSQAAYSDTLGDHLALAEAIRDRAPERARKAALSLLDNVRVATGAQAEGAKKPRRRSRTAPRN